MIVFIYTKLNTSFITKNASAKNLYHLKTDRTETHNLADFNPQKLQEMIALYDQWAKKVGVEVRAKAGGGE